MGVKVYVPAEETWLFFQKNKSRLVEEMVVAAENDETGYAVYITEDCGYPCFSVCKGQEPPEYEEGTISMKDCSETANKCYKNYLYSDTAIKGDCCLPNQGVEDDDDCLINLTKLQKEDAMYEREESLQLAVCDFLQVVLQEGCDGTEVMDTYGLAIINEILDSFLQLIAYDYGLPVYRPTIFTDEVTGEDIYTDYPYNDDIDDTEDDI